MAGFIPGILLAAVWCVYIYFKCKKSNIQDTKVYTKEEKKEIWKKSIWALLYPFIVLGGIYFGFATPVSYTHLDVYKRQPLKRSLCCPA